MNNQQGNNTVLDTSRVVKQKQPNTNELPTSENRNAAKPNNSHPNNHKKHYHKNKRYI